MAPVGQLNYMLPRLHIVALFAKLPAYGTETLLGRADRKGVEAAVRRVAFRGTPGWQDLSIAKPAGYRLFRLRTPPRSPLDG